MPAILEEAPQQMISFCQRLRLVRSLFGCGFILTGTHPSIVENENVITAHARTLVNREIETDVGVFAN